MNIKYLVIEDSTTVKTNRKLSKDYSSKLIIQKPATKKQQSYTINSPSLSLRSLILLNNCTLY